MFKNFNWGHGITVFYIFFVGAVLTALIASFGIDHSLVVDDYYAQDLAYQKQYDKISNNLDSDSLTISYDKINEKITFDFSEESKVKGQVYFYRPSDQSQDFKVEVKSNQEEVLTDQLVKGKWRLKVDWTSGSKSYYKEEIINI